MAKKIKSSKKQQKKPAQSKESYFFFVKDQGEGAAKIAVIVLKLAEIALTTIFAVCLGIFGPILLGKGEDAEIFADSPVLVIWLVTSVIYIIGLFVVMFGKSKAAAVIHTIAAVGTLILYSSFESLFRDVPDSRGPSELYMPCLFITVITIIIMFLINFPKWVEKRISEENAAAPSVLGGEYKAVNTSGKKSKNKSKSRK